MSWTTLHMQVTTPLFNSGADQDSEAQVRVSSIRGAIRFWFRALAGVGIGKRVRDLLALEERVFGSTDVSSPVKFRIPSQPRLTPAGLLDWLGNTDNDGPWFAYLLGQGLAKLERKDDRMGRSGSRYVCHARRPYLAPGEAFDLQFRYSDTDAAAAVLASLWLACAYGGVGARVRRGMGGIRIMDVDGPIPDPWTAASLRSPDLDFYEQRHLDPSKPELWVPDVVGPCVSAIARVAARVKVSFDHRSVPDEGRPPYPMFSRQYAIAAASGGRPFQEWPQVLAEAAEELRSFRASEDYPQARYHPKIKTPEWKRTVHGADQAFGLGALGLPVNYKDSYSVQADKGKRKDDRLRRASPLWLRAVGEGNRWRLLSLAFHNDFLPDDVGVHVWKRDPRQQRDQRQKPVTVTDQDVVDRTNEWLSTMRAGNTFVRR